MSTNEEPTPMRWGDKVRVTRSTRPEPEVMDWADLVLYAEEGCFDGLDEKHGAITDPGGQTLTNADGTEWAVIERVTEIGVAG